GATRQQHAPHLPGREAERRVALVLGHKLDAGARRPRHLPALARLQLDVVHERAGGDALERQRVPGLDVGARAGLQLGADPEACRSEDVRLEAVRVVEQRDPGRPVRVVLDRGHPRRDAVLRPLEVDDAVAALVASALVAGGDAAVRVAAALLGQLLGQRLLGLRLRDVGEVGDRHEAAARARRLEAANRPYHLAPWKTSIVSPGFSWTTAFFQPGFVPRIIPRRLGLGCTLRMLTLTTCTSKSSSIAWRTWVLCASSCTRNVYLPWTEPW